jgi:hypothetical protein
LYSEQLQLRFGKLYLGRPQFALLTTQIPHRNIQTALLAFTSALLLSQGKHAGVVGLPGDGAIPANAHN